MKERLLAAIWMALVLSPLIPSAARAQLVVIDDVILMTSEQKKKSQERIHRHLDPPGGENLLGPSPGADEPRLGEEPENLPTLGGVLSRRSLHRSRRRGSAKRLHAAGTSNPYEEDDPFTGTLELPAKQEETSGGLTLGAAVERLLAVNADLAAKAKDLPKARADVLTAGLRGNPFVFVSFSNVPYGSYSRRRPGTTGYDLTFIQPLDVNGKRRYRIRAAEQAKSVLEAQYQDAVRQEVAKLYAAYVNVLAQRLAVRAFHAGLQRLIALEKTTREHGSRIEARRIFLRRAGVEKTVQEAETALVQVRRRLAVLLAVPPDRADQLYLSDSLCEDYPTLPCIEQLIDTAFQTRPDLRAYRLGKERAKAEVRLARAEAIDDVFLFYTPFSATDFSPQGDQSAFGWGLDAIFPVPIFDRNQGDIARARANVTQTELERQVLQHRIANEVQNAATECERSRLELEQYQREILPAAHAARDENYRLFVQGRQNLDSLLEFRVDYEESVRGYLQALVRRRRAMLQLTVVIGRRVP